MWDSRTQAGVHKRDSVQKRVGQRHLQLNGAEIKKKKENCANRNACTMPVETAFFLALEKIKNTLRSLIFVD